MNRKVILILSILVLILAACGASATESPMLYSEDAGFAEEGQNSTAPSEPGMDIDETDYGPVERLVIQNANLTIVVENPSDASTEIGEMAVDKGGYVISTNLYRTYTSSGVEIPQGSIVVRVPAEELANTLEDIRDLSDQPVVSENITSQDVTDEYVDLRSRLRNAKAAEAELSRIMENADTTTDVLDVYSELKQVREEIEVIQGRMQYYEQSAAYSMISVELLVNEPIQPLSIGGWEPKGVARDAVQALIYALQFLANAGIWFVLFCAPVLLIIGIPLLIILAVIRAQVLKNRKNKAVTQASGSGES